MQIEGRDAWGAKPPESVTPWDPSKLEGICQHWFGSPKAAATHAGCDDLLRSVQRTHQAGEYSDIAYNFGVCPHGVAYELRGWNVQTGANGTTEANRNFIAFVYMAGTGDPLTVKGKAALEALYAEAFKRGVGVKAITHGSITGSACPGPAVKAWLASGAWKPKPAKVKFELTTGEGKVLDDSVAAETDRAAQEERLAKFLTTLARNPGLLIDEFDHDEKTGQKPVPDVHLRRLKL